jgi:hypothetical protein
VRTALLAVVLAAPAAALQTNVGGASAQFLQIGAGARSLGMGEAYSAVAEGADSVYWNPAGLSRMPRPEATYARTELPAGLHHDFFAVGVPSSLLSGTIALGVTRLSQDSLALVNASNQTRGSFSPHSEVFALGYGHAFAANDLASTSREYFRDNWNIPRADRPYENEREPWTGEISAGAAVKLITEDLGTRSASAFAVDGGGMFRPTDLHELIVAGAFRNIGSKITFISQAEVLPAELAASVAYDARTDEWRFLPALEVAAPYAGNVYGKLGFEATKTISDGTSAAMRVGYTSVSAADLGPLAGVTAGVGLKAGKFSFDAAFQPLALLGQAFRLGVGWQF